MFGLVVVFYRQLRKLERGIHGKRFEFPWPKGFPGRRVGENVIRFNLRLIFFLTLHERRKLY